MRAILSPSEIFPYLLDSPFEPINTPYTRTLTCLHPCIIATHKTTLPHTCIPTTHKIELLHANTLTYPHARVPATRKMSISHTLILHSGIPRFPHCPYSHTACHAILCVINKIGKCGHKLVSLTSTRN
jgi:hypothetical protein